MTEEEIKALAEADPTIVDIAADAAPTPAAAEDEAAKRFASQMKAMQDTADAERRAREAAQARAAELEQEATRYQTQAKSAEADAIAAAIQAATHQREIAQREYRAAMESGEYDKAAEAQGKLSEASAEIVQLRRDKAMAELSKPEAPRQPQTHQVDPVESFIASATPATQTWLRQHRDLIQRDRNGAPVLDERLLAAHNLSIIERIQPDTPEYFTYIESKINPPAGDDEVIIQPAPKQRAAPVSAPVTREPPMSNGQPSTRRMQLTKEQVEMAHLSGDPKKTPREREIAYWENLQLEKAEGRYGRYSH